MKLYHLTIAVEGRRALGRVEAEHRELVRALVRVCGEHLLLFCLVDDHLHVLLRALRAGYLARETRRALGRLRPDLVLDPSHVKPVERRSHLSWLVRYLLGQPAKHGLSVPPALWTGSCFQDLVGARLLPGFDRTRLLEELPRFRLREAYEAVGLEPTQLAPADDEALRRAGAARVLELAAGVFAAGPELTGRSRFPHEVAARRLGAHAGRVAGIPPSELARYLGVQPRAVRHLARGGLEREALIALRRRLTLEQRARAAAVRGSAA